MSTLFHMKQYHNLQDSADYVSEKLGEKVSPDDILQLASQEKITLSCKLPETLVQEVPSEAINISIGSREDLSFEDSLLLDQSSDETKMVSGIFRLPTSSKHFKKWLLGHSFNNPFAHSQSKIQFGLVIQDHITHETFKCVYAPRHSFITKSGTVEFNYLGHFPIELDSLVILPKDLTAFISSLDQTTQKNKIIRTTESTLLDALGLMAIALSETNSRLRHGDRPNAKRLAEHVEQTAGRLYLEFENSSNLERDISTAIKQVRSSSKTLP